jgi:two-component system, NarL family, sensor histidine kinase DesK
MMKTVWGHITRGYVLWEKYVTDMAGAEAPVVSSGISPRLWRLNVRFWLILPLLYPLIALLQAPLVPQRLLIVLPVVALVVVIAGWLLWPHPVSGGASPPFRLHRALLLAFLTALVLWLSLAYGSYWLWLLICVSAAAGGVLPIRGAVVAVSILMVLSAGMSIGIDGGVLRATWLQIIPLVLLVRGLGLDMIGLARLSSAIRDLHDLLGQTLSMITLKSELARHLIAEDHERCAQELTEIERVARKSLREVREAVAGYRQPRLESELEGARQLLEAAGIDSQIEPNTLVLPPETSAVLAWTVREGVTNVIRHSRARHCEIMLIQGNGTVGAEVINDGGREACAESPSGRPGLGLAGLRERVSALGGRMQAGPLTLSGKEHFRVRVELPIHPGVEAPVLQEERS